MIKFLIADDHPLYREALKGAMQTKFSDASFVESDSFSSLVSALNAQRNITLLLLDLYMPGCENFYGLLRVRKKFPKLPIVVISANDDIETVAQVMGFGANAYVTKNSPTAQLIEAVNTVLAGENWLPKTIARKIDLIASDKISIAQKISELTPKQFKVLTLVKKGLTNKQIANELNVTEATVKAHVGSIFKRLDVKSRTQILVAIELLNLA